MNRNQKTQQQEQHQQTIRRTPFSSSLTLLKLFYLEERPQKQNYQNPKYHHSQHHRQKHKATLCFPRCGLISLIFLSVIKDSLTITHTTSYSLSIDVITTTPQSNYLPYFDFDVQRNITVTVGQTGFLHCRVERLGDKDVSWIRKRDLHILTAGSTTYTSDQRFQVLRPENSGNWTLQIKYPQPRDSGIYECQINTEPKMSLSYTFNVVELVATIIGPSDLYVKSGSDINLICKIMQGPHELGNIFWYKGSEIIDMTANQNEIDSGTRIMMENDWSDGLTSRLKIRKASSSDTGNYTCVPTIAKSSSVYVHVIIGEHPAAMQHNSSNTVCHQFCLSLCCMLFTILTCCCFQDLMYSCTKNNRVNRAKTTSRTLSQKGASTSLSLLLKAAGTANATATLQSASASVSASTSTSKTTIVKTVTFTKIIQSIQYILSIESFTKAKSFSLSELFQTSPATNRAVAALSGTCEKRVLSFRNGRNTR